MADPNLLLQEIEALGAPAPQPELSTLDNIIGYGRSFASGPLLNFNDEIEAAMQTAAQHLNPWSPDTTYRDQLNRIHAEQDQFKAATDYTDNAVELAASLANPLGVVGKVAKGANYGLTTLNRLFTNPVSQAAIAGAGTARDGQNILDEAGKSALFGAAGSSLASLFGRTASTAAKEADKLKLSAYGIKNAAITGQLKKLGDKVDELGSAQNLPILKTLDAAEKKGLISADNDILENITGLAREQNKLGRNLGGLLDDANKVVPADPLFSTPFSEAYINKFSGTAQDNAIKAWAEELDALKTQLGSGTLADLQKAKLGLNYKFDQNPYKGDIIKALRSDLRAEIEKRVNTAAQGGLLKLDTIGKVKALNQEFGAIADLKDSLLKRAGTDLGGDVVEDFIRSGATSGGTGTLNLMAAGGSPIAAAASGLLNVARQGAAKSAIADTLREFRTPLAVGGDALQELGTARTFAQGAENSTYFNPPTEQQKQNVAPKAKPTPQASTDDLMREILKLGAAQPTEDKVNTGATSVAAPLAQNISMQTGGDMKLKDLDLEKVAATEDVKEVEKLIDSDLIDAAIYETESSRNPLAKNPVSTAKGGFQLIDATAKSLKVKDPLKLGENYIGYKKLRDENEGVIRALGFEPSPELVYSAHFLGAPVFRKYMMGKALDKDEREQVMELRKKALPNFQTNYNNLVQKADGNIKV